MYIYFVCVLNSVRVIKENFGIKHGCITTVHDVTATQVRLTISPFVERGFLCVIMCLRSIQSQPKH